MSAFYEALLNYQMKINFQQDKKLVVYEMKVLREETFNLMEPYKEEIKKLLEVEEIVLEPESSKLYIFEVKQIEANEKESGKEFWGKGKFLEQLTNGILQLLHANLPYIEFSRFQVYYPGMRSLTSARIRIINAVPKKRKPAEIIKLLTHPRLKFPKSLIKEFLVYLASVNEAATEGELSLFLYKVHEILKENCKDKDIEEKLEDFLNTSTKSLWISRHSSRRKTLEETIKKLSESPPEELREKVMEYKEELEELFLSCLKKHIDNGE